jgi:hypothetical protein
MSPPDPTDPPSPTATPADRPTALPALAGKLLRHGPVMLGLAAAVAITHGPSVDSGLFIDDWNHAEQASLRGYSLWDLAWGFEFDFNNVILPAWWGDGRMYLHYFRPFTVLLHKLLWDLFGLDPVAHHLHSLGWHLAATFLVYGVGLAWMGCRAGAGAAALAFAVHPVQAVPVQWCAAAMEPINAVWTLLCLWAVIRAMRPDAGRPGTWWAVSYAAAAMALMSREAAVMLPLVIPLAARWWLPRLLGVAPAGWLRLAPYAAMTAAFMAWRTVTLGGFPTPPFPYFTGPDRPADLARHVFEKALCNSAAVMLCAPAPPVLAESMLAEHPWLWAVGTAAVGAVGWLVWLGARRAPGGAASAGFWAAWFVLFCAPTLPMFVAPHYLYTPVIGWAMLLGAALSVGLKRAAETGSAWRRRGWTAGAAVVAVVYGAVLIVETLTLRGAYLPGQLTLEDIVTRREGYPPGAKLFFINLSPLAHEIMPAVRTNLGRRDLLGRVLTFSPGMLGPETPTRVRVLDRFTLELTADPARPWFSGRAGRTLLMLAGRARPLEAGETFPGPDFTVTVREADETGVTRMEFRFAEPLDSPGYVFLLGSAWNGTTERFAAPLDLSTAETAAPVEGRGR